MIIKPRFVLIISALMAICLISASCTQKKTDREKLVIFHAGSFAYPLKILSDKYAEKHPGVEILRESAGSVASARKLTELGKDCDILISSDYRIIDEMLIPDFASWNLHFSSNELCLAFHKSSKEAQKINPKNWHEIVLLPDIRTGRSDPASDPCGYRTEMLFQLSENFYKIPGFSYKMSSKDISWIRPKEVDLLALLETGSVDYIFIYRSVAVQHQLDYVQLPDSVNLGHPELNGFYNEAVVEIPGKRPGEKLKLTGEAIVYSLTIPDNALNPDLAMQFVNFMIGETGGRIISQLGQNMITPPACDNFDILPESIRKTIELTGNEAP